MRTHRFTILELAVFTALLAGCAHAPEPSSPVDTQPATQRLGDGAFEILVDARAGWVATTIEVKDGETLKIRADGQWGESPGVTRNADGGPAGMFGSGYWGVTPPVPGPTRWGALVGRIGGGPAFLIGTVCTVKADRPGVLELSINDGPGRMADNHGTMRVHIGEVR